MATPKTEPAPKEQENTAMSIVDLLATVPSPSGVFEADPVSGQPEKGLQRLEDLTKDMSKAVSQYQQLLKDNPKLKEFLNGEACLGMMVGRAKWINDLMQAHLNYATEQAEKISAVTVTPEK